MKSYLYRIRQLLKKNQFVYFTRMRLLDNDYKNCLKEMKSSSLKSHDQIEQELKLVQKYWGCKPLHYIRYQLYNKELSEEELLDYIPPYYHYNFYTDSLYDGIALDSYNDKLQCHKIFQERSIPTPKVIGYYNNNCIYDLCDKIIDINILIKSLEIGKKIFFKPTLAAGGTGILVLKRNGNDVYFNENIVTNSEQVLSLLDNRELYIIQEGIVQRSDFRDINESSVNTLRSVTQWRNGNPVLSVCVMRMGRDGKDVDNSHQGGLSVEVYIESGRLASKATAEHGGGIYTKHPDSGFVFNNFIIDNWEEIKSQIIDCAKQFPEIPEIAWDVAVTNDGIEMIELNTGYGIDHLQCCCGGLRQRLKVFPK